MKTKTGPTLMARSPAWLTAKADLEVATRIARDRHSRVAWMLRRNEEHGNEVAEKRRTSGYPLMTACQAMERGTGSGYEIIYFRCSCVANCTHDPAETPFSEVEIRDAEIAAVEADEAVTEALRVLENTEQEFDVFAAARRVKATHVWWPFEQNVDPRRHRYRGAPISEDELTKLGVHGLLREISNGTAIEVPQ